MARALLPRLVAFLLPALFLATALAAPRAPATAVAEPLAAALPGEIVTAVAVLAQRVEAAAARPDAPLGLRQAAPVCVLAAEQIRFAGAGDGQVPRAEAVEAFHVCREALRAAALG